MWKKLACFTKPRPSAILGMDIGTRYIKMASVSFQQNRPKLQQLRIIDRLHANLAEDWFQDTSSTAEWLRQELSVAGISAGPIVAAINGRTVFMRDITFPLMQQEELQEAVRWDIEKYVPFPPDSYYYDFAVLNKRIETMEMDVFLAAAPKRTIDGLAEVFHKAGLKPMAIDIEPLAIYRTMENAENSLLVDIGAELSHITVFQDGAPALTRMIQSCGNRFTERIMESIGIDRTAAESMKRTALPEILPQVNEFASDLAAELHRTIEYLQTQNKQVKLARIVLSGGGIKSLNLPQQLEQEMGLAVVVHDPFIHLEIDDSFERQYIQTVAPQMAVAVGLALRGVEL
ncbi:MAG: type pilus assembly protein PilM [Firmicutes bacterium]|nr:type pilus assembly protein PilM [Bacillota bacterium]